ncbi:hypothetical protein C6H88_02300 [Chlamydia muridarum str. Nigg]|uniref:Membrane protein n=2 Tax=Chlamydia muridarum TaxID=83560 RepID=A0A069ZS81_CHLMR|nr:vitamin K epoxide reductase family protein [Chlamydia muridarum]UFT31930.1 vitamin K epoxide reductase family protein [Chlamydia trachomatis]AAF39304.1 conserved hypothetical protein [Chlamydia muridarum str. Nigg]AHH22835.1 membrane protein [Chlamydia muridarum str. Nigg3 CMUT3-5]AHH23760.1 membrane protein [Chlamydia muridarum str. Nigg CM972]AID37971.1 membrane protein [Chlamydia muridarum str. Nigg 2 MCR]
MDKDLLENVYRHFRYRFFKLSILPALLGLWLFFTPDILNYLDATVILSDRVCGILLILLSALSFYNPIILRLGVFIGLWVSVFSCSPNFSPLVFAHDSLLGFATLAIICLLPNRPEDLEVGPTIPETSDYNPSSGGKRGAVLLFSFLGWLQSRYLTSIALNIADADTTCSLFFSSILMVIYSMLIVLSLTGGERRWHTRPKAVCVTAFMLFFALGATLIAILLSQLSLTNYAGINLTIAPVFSLAFFYDEIRATWQYLTQFSSDRKKLTKVAFYGSEYYRESFFWEERSVLPFSKACKQAFEGLSFPLNLVFACILAIGFVQINTNLAIPNTCRFFVNNACWFILVLSIFSFAKSLRHLRWLSLLFAAGILLSPVIFHLPLEAKPLLSIVASGIAFIGLSIGRL